MNLSTFLTGVVNDRNLNFRNKIINGNFDVWQREYVFNTSTSLFEYITQVQDINNQLSSKFLADRWPFYAGTGTNQTFTCQKGTFTQAEAATFESRPKFYGRWLLGTQATGSQANRNMFYHRVEGLHPYAGKIMTLSFWARSNNVGSSILNCYCSQTYRVSSPFTQSPSVVSLPTFTLTSNWQKYTATFTVAPIDTTTYNLAWGANDRDSTWDSFTQIVFNIPGSSGRFVDMTSVQLEEGPIATPFEQRPIGLERHLCYRYFYKMVSGQIAGIASTGSAMIYQATFPVSMRKVPSFSYARLTTSIAATIEGWNSEYVLPDGIDSFKFAAYTTSPVAASLGAFNATYTDLRWDAEY